MNIWFQELQELQSYQQPQIQRKRAGIVSSKIYWHSWDLWNILCYGSCTHVWRYKASLFSRILLHIFIIWGFLSSCYHVCPTEENFQFDTTFMYCISVLVFLKVCRASLSSIVLLFVDAKSNCCRCTNSGTMMWPAQLTLCSLSLL